LQAALLVLSYIFIPNPLLFIFYLRLFLQSMLVFGKLDSTSPEDMNYQLIFSTVLCWFSLSQGEYGGLGWSLEHLEGFIEQTPYGEQHTTASLTAREGLRKLAEEEF
jgi:hypothetical protein